jgi:diguanylate cyclase (GGDEF)-like protein
MIETILAVGFTSAVYLAYIKRLIQERDALKDKATHDPLTGLANRSLFHDRLSSKVDYSTRYGAGLAIMIIDLDGFKHVNDTYGHAAGDFLLQVIAGRINACTRSNDTVVRLGGDEFAIILPEIDNDRSAITIANKIINTIAESVIINGREVSVTASIGIALHSRYGSSADELIESADLAMYSAKNNGKNSYRLA